ncbi:MAG: alpha/beta fold hydrolase [Candidatus Eremiobacteraeota bacterium]|nr:alpha/beta fold hydrolase [Candidatus Eremiobacteraeota bacterium]
MKKNATPPEKEPVGLAGELKRNSRFFTMRDFTFEGGMRLPEVKIEYTTLGNPQRDEKGIITNAVMFVHGWRSDGYAVETWKSILGPGKALDREKYFIVSPCNLGVPGSASPSTTGLGPDFPRYSMGDLARALYELLTVHLGIGELKVLLGQCGGGVECLTLLDRYPYLACGAVIVSPGFPCGRSLAVLDCLRRLLLEDPAYQEGRYKDPPRMGLAMSYMALFPWLLSFEYFESQFGSLKLIDKRLREELRHGMVLDANDLLWQLECIMADPIMERIGEIKTRVLVTGIERGDIMAPVEEMIKPFVKKLPRGELFTYYSALGHLGCVFEIDKADRTIADFIDSLS